MNIVIIEHAILYTVQCFIVITFVMEKSRTGAQDMNPLKLNNWRLTLLVLIVTQLLLSLQLTCHVAHVHQTPAMVVMEVIHSYTY